MNPARSLGPALFAGGDALAHVWLFIVAPLIGAALAVAARAGADRPAGHRGSRACSRARRTTGDRTGAELPADEQPVQIPPPAAGRHDHRAPSA